MTYISFCELESSGEFPSLMDSLEKKPYVEKDEIISFLKTGKVVFTRLSRVKDILTGEIIPMEIHAMSNGEFCWCNVLAWYVEKHNLRLPKDFEDYILSQAADKK